jgi:hypothetical protein
VLIVFAPTALGDNIPANGAAVVHQNVHLILTLWYPIVDVVVAFDAYESLVLAIVAAFHTMGDLYFAGEAGIVDQIM